jgi:hypothetical protein
VEEPIVPYSDRVAILSREQEILLEDSDENAKEPR